MRDVRRPGRSPVSTASGALWAGVAAVRAPRAPRCPSSRAAGYGWGSAAAATGAGGGFRVAWPSRGPGRLTPLEGTAGGSMAPAPTCTLGAPGLSKTAEPCSCARAADAPGVHWVRLASVGPWRPGEGRGRCGPIAPGRARRFPVGALALRSMLGSALGVPASRSGPAQAPRPSRLSRPRPPRLSAPFPPRSGPVGAFTQGGGPSRPRRAPHCGENRNSALSELPALVAVHTGTRS